MGKEEPKRTEGREGSPGAAAAAAAAAIPPHPRTLERQQNKEERRATPTHRRFEDDGAVAVAAGPTLARPASSPHPEAKATKLSKQDSGEAGRPTAEA